MTPQQRAVLEWMAAYPGVEVSWEPGERAHWTMAWASEEARLHMIGVMDHLGVVYGPTDGNPAPRTLPHGGTPRLTTPTFQALVRRGFVRAVKHRPAQGVWGSATYWQISLAGVYALNPRLGFLVGGLAVSA